MSGETESGESKVEEQEAQALIFRSENSWLSLISMPEEAHPVDVYTEEARWALLIWQEEQLVQALKSFTEAVVQGGGTDNVPDGAFIKAARVIQNMVIGHHRVEAPFTEPYESDRKEYFRRLETETYSPAPQVFRRSK